jgi:hypothetical protein
MLGRKESYIPPSTMNFQATIKTLREEKKE